MTISRTVKKIREHLKKNPDLIAASAICFIFLAAFLTLSLVKHAHFGTGYDLSIDSQIIWEFSRFKMPISTTHVYAFTPFYYDHIELVYALLAPFYWILSDARMLLILQVIAVTLTGFCFFLLSRKYNINKILSCALLISFFSFYGVQNAVWYDAHSLVFGFCSLVFFIYFLEIKKKWLAVLFFILTLISKEDMGLILFFVSLVYLIRTRNKINIIFMLVSAIYVAFLFLIFYPHFTLGYQYANEQGFLTNINLFNYFNSPLKRSVYIYSFGAFGFIPLLSPLLLLPFFADIGHYFVIGSSVTRAVQINFGHYRYATAVLLMWPTILTIGKFKKLNNKYLAIYIIFCAFLTTYMLHAPLTYLSKKWFWTKPSGVNNINKAINYLPKDAYIATQTNIASHASSRKMIVTVLGDRKNFSSSSPCGKENCAWFKWAGHPDYLLVDTSPEWDARHLLANRPDFIEGLENMEIVGKIKLVKQFDSTKIYKINY